MNPNLRVYLKIILYPVVILRRLFYKHYMIYLQEHNLKKLAGVIYRLNFRRKLNWNSPQNLSEKINWMKFNTDTSKWSDLADKFSVREYVKSKGLEDILVPLYGVWENADQIDFNLLPNSFVLKTNHACGTVLLVEDKNLIDIEETRILLNKWMNIKIGKETAEPHYLSIKPLIIAEHLLRPLNGDVVDYKLYTVNGNTELVMVCSNRKIGVGAEISLYDAEWNYCPDRLCVHYSKDYPPKIPKPVTFEKMKEYAYILCKDFPFVRMDFYDIDGRIFFGEMTFTPKGGYCSTLSDEEQLRIGRKITLPILK